ncbi:MAG: hypothetical protein JWO38_1200 [Gemmataceae bacterium]|nr:hypothetical protein [Gemmataceae bacterium]
MAKKKAPAKPKFVPIRLPGKGKIPLKVIREAVKKVREMELARQKLLETAS